MYTFESTSDDGSWIYLNERPLLDNGGTHPAKTARRTVRLSRGWYGFRLQYEDTGGDRLLRLRLSKNHLPLAVHAGDVFFRPRPAILAGARERCNRPGRNRV